ncbi:hypothetical protein ACFLS8_03560 [Chloroflexota bacterium]
MTRVCFVVKVSGEFCATGYQGVLQELAAMPEVESIEQVEGISNVLVEVGTPVDMRVLADKILAKKGIKGLRILNIEPTEL